MNAHQLDALQGHWSTGVVRGHLKEAGWGAEKGYPGLIVDAEGPGIEVHLFYSDDLPHFWKTLDTFEGPGYNRVEVMVETAAGHVAAYIYALA